MSIKMNKGETKIEFEEQFPSLKNERIIKLTNKNGIGSCSILKSGPKIFLAEDIQKYCLDKVKVREAILNNLRPVGTTHEDVKKLLKELGLK